MSGGDWEITSQSGGWTDGRPESCPENRLSLSRIGLFESTATDDCCAASTMLTAPATAPAPAVVATVAAAVTNPTRLKPTEPPANFSLDLDLLVIQCTRLSPPTLSMGCCSCCWDLAAGQLRRQIRTRRGRGSCCWQPISVAAIGGFSSWHSPS